MAKEGQKTLKLDETSQHGMYGMYGNICLSQYEKYCKTLTGVPIHFDFDILTQPVKEKLGKTAPVSTYTNTLTSKRIQLTLSIQARPK